MAKKRTNRIIIILVLAIVALLIIAVVFKRGGSGFEVETQPAEARTIIEMVSASGKIYPEDEVVIIPEIAGEVIALYVQEGDSVRKDDKLAKINPDIFEDALKRAEAAVLTAKANLGNAKARAAQAKAQLERARLDFNRSKQLLADQVIAQAEFDAAQANYNVAEAEQEAAKESVNAAQFNVQSAEATLQETKNNLVRTTVYAPMDGIVTSLDVEEGKVVGGISTFAATEMMRVSNLDVMEAQVEVSENDILRITIGDTALIEVEAYDDRTFKGLVTQISSSADNALQLSSDQATNFTVKIQILKSSYQDLIDQKGAKFPFLPGMSAAVDIITTTKDNVLTIPIEAVTTRTPKQLNDSTLKDSKADDLMEVVFVADEQGKAKAVPVKTGIQDDQYIEILEGIADGDEIITGPYTTVQRTLQKGTSLTVKEKEQNNDKQ